MCKEKSSWIQLSWSRVGMNCLWGQFIHLIWNNYFIIHFKEFGVNLNWLILYNCIIFYFLFNICCHPLWYYHFLIIFFLSFLLLRFFVRYFLLPFCGFLWLSTFRELINPKIVVAVVDALMRICVYTGLHFDTIVLCRYTYFLL